MKPKMMLKMGIDLVMTVLLLCQMAYMLVGETVHEYLGTAMFVLFILHHLLNRNWYRSLKKGRYGAVRVLQTAVNTLVLLCMLGLMVSGVILSREVFAFLPIQGGMGFARILHMLASYWGFVLMSVHLGLHWGMVMRMARRLCRKKESSAVCTVVLRLLAAAVCVFGIYAFAKNNIADYLFQRSQFVFFDMEQPLALFFAEYLAMMGLWVCLAYYLSRALQRLSTGKEGKEKA